MSHEISGEDLFGKSTEGNLNKRGLAKAKKKERVEIIESNLPFLVDFYFGAGQRKDRKYLDKVYHLVGYDKYFMDPVLKILGAGKKKKKKVNLDAIPEGLHVILIDSMDNVRSEYSKRIHQYYSNNTPKTQESMDRIQELKEAAHNQLAKLNEVVALIIEKQVKKLESIGLPAQYAAPIAASFVPKKYLTKENVWKYFRRLNASLVRAHNMCMVRSEETDEDGRVQYMNDADVNLASAEAILSIYRMFFKGVDHDVYLAALTSVLLETRGKYVDSYTKPQREMYNAISRTIADILEGNDVVKDADRKCKNQKLSVSKKDLKKVVKAYSKRRIEDFRRGNDQPRRIIISNLSDEVYPRIHKAFEKQNKESARSVIDGDYEREQEERQRQRQNEKNKNRNDNDNRNGNSNDRRDNNNGNGKKQNH